MRTLEPVPAGAPLLHCYGPQVGEMTTAQRRGMLARQYRFHCNCRACGGSGSSGGDGDAAVPPSGASTTAAADVAAAGLRCPAAIAATASTAAGPLASRGCEGGVLPPCAVPAGLLHRFELPTPTLPTATSHGGQASIACCTACGAALSQQQWEEGLLPQLQAAAAAQRGAVELLEQQEREGSGGEAASAGGVMQAVRALRQCLRQRQLLLHPYSQLLGATHDCLARAWHLAGNHEAAAQHLRHSLVALRRAYPPGSTAVAYQQLQLAASLRLAAAAAAAGGTEGGAVAAAALAEARREEAEANAALELHFGPASAGDEAAAGVR